MERITLRNVRLSFPSLFKRATFDGQEGKFEATFLIDKADTKTKKILDDAIAEAIAEAKIKVPKDKICLRDGDDSPYTEDLNVWSFKAASNRRPTLINRDKTQLAEDDEVLYAGCYVNAIVDMWVQSNQWGKRVNGNLYGVQFVKDGEPFGMGTVDVTDDFSDLGDDEDDDL